MKCLIVNAKSFSYTDKATKETVPAVVLDVVKNVAVNASGKGVKELFIGKKYQEELYNTLALVCNGQFSTLNGKLVNFEFDDDKNIVSFEIVKTEKPAVTWGF